MAKTKISVTVDASLMERVDLLAKGASRSAVVQKALERFVRNARRQSLEEEIERYYAGLTKSEQAEDESWAALGARSLSETWDE